MLNQPCDLTLAENQESFLYSESGYTPALGHSDYWNNVTVKMTFMVARSFSFTNLSYWKQILIMLKKQEIRKYVLKKENDSLTKQEIILKD